MRGDMTVTIFAVTVAIILLVALALVMMQSIKNVQREMGEKEGKKESVVEVIESFLQEVETSPMKYQGFSNAYKRTVKAFESQNLANIFNILGKPAMVAVSPDKCETSSVCVVLSVEYTDEYGKEETLLCSDWVESGNIYTIYLWRCGSITCVCAREVI